MLVSIVCCAQVFRPCFRTSTRCDNEADNDEFSDRQRCDALSQRLAVLLCGSLRLPASLRLLALHLIFLHALEETET